MRTKNRRGVPPGPSGPHPPRPSWRREAVEFGALFTAAGVAHVFATGLGDRESGSLVLLGLGGVLCAVVGAHLWWAHRPPLPPGARATTAMPLTPTRLWRVRVRVRETPGRLAALATAIAAADGNIMALSSQSDADGTVDELHVELPARVPAEALASALTAAGGRAVSVRPATVHELVDPITRTLLLASSARAEPRRLPAVLAMMFDAHLVSGAEPCDERETLSLVSAAGRPIRLHRPGVPFTTSETARALAMLDLSDQPCPA